MVRGQPVRHGRRRARRAARTSSSAGARRHRRLDARAARAVGDATAYCASQVRRRRLHPGARGRAGGPGRRHPARPGRHADRVLRRPHRAVQARPGRPAQRPRRRRRGGAVRPAPAGRLRGARARRRLRRRSRPGRDRPRAGPAGARARRPAHRRRRRCAALRRRLARRTALVLGGPAPLGALARRLGVVDEVLPRAGSRRRSPAAGRPPDVAVNLHGRGPQSHRLLAGAAARRLVAFACPAAGSATGPAWRADEHEVDRWCRLVALGRRRLPTPTDLRLPSPHRASAQRQRACVHPGAARRVPALAGGALGGGGRRPWPRTGHRVVVTGHPRRGRPVRARSRPPRPGVEDACGRLDLRRPGRPGRRGRRCCSAATPAWRTSRRPSARRRCCCSGRCHRPLWGPAIDPHLHRSLWHARRCDPRPGDPHGAVRPAAAATAVPEVVDAPRTCSSCGRLRGRQVRSLSSRSS